MFLGFINAKQNAEIGYIFALVQVVLSNWEPCWLNLMHQACKAILVVLKHMDGVL